MRPEDEFDGWVRVPFRDEEEGGKEVPGVFVHLPVTILRPSGRQVVLHDLSNYRRMVPCSSRISSNSSVCVPCWMDLIHGLMA